MQTRRYTNIRYDDHAPAGPGRADWRDDAACRDIGGDVFFPDPSDQGAVGRARKICDQCPVQVTCLKYALDDSTLAGVWGGTSEKERKGIRAAAGRKNAGFTHPENVRANAVDRWRRGVATNEIARSLGVSTRTILRWVDAA